MHNIVHTRLGDDDTKQENTKKGGGAKITPIMRCYPGSLHMVNTNAHLTEKSWKWFTVQVQTDQAC